MPPMGRNRNDDSVAVSVFLARSLVNALGEEVPELVEAITDMGAVPHVCKPDAKRTQLDDMTDLMAQRRSQVQVHYVGDGQDAVSTARELLEKHTDWLTDRSLTRVFCVVAGIYLDELYTRQMFDADVYRRVPVLDLPEGLTVARLSAQLGRALECVRTDGEYPAFEAAE